MRMRGRSPFTFVRTREPQSGVEHFAKEVTGRFEVQDDQLVYSPDPIRYSQTPTRPAKVPIVFFLDQRAHEMERLRHKVAYSSPVASQTKGSPKVPIKRFNIVRPQPEAYGSQYEIKG